MDPIQFLVRVAAAALLVSGMRKFPEPEPTCKALKLVGLPSHRPWAWGLGFAEVTIGMVALRSVTPATSAVVGVTYLALAAFVWRARKAGIACGCFGQGEHPPSLLHLGLDIVAVLVCGIAVATLSMSS